MSRIVSVLLRQDSPNRFLTRLIISDRWLSTAGCGAESCSRAQQTKGGASLTVLLESKHRLKITGLNSYRAVIPSAFDFVADLLQLCADSIQVSALDFYVAVCNRSASAARILELF